MIAVIVAAVGIGVGIQAARSGSSGTVAKPAHALGPGGSEIEGQASTPVLVEQYGDFQCPNCGVFEKATYPTIHQLVQQGRIRFAYYPIAFIGPDSIAASNAAECAGDSGQFWAFHDALFAHQFAENSGALTEDYLIQLGAGLGLTSPTFSQCVRAGTYDGWIKQVTDQSSRRGVTGTPTVYVNGQPLRSYTPQGLLAAVDAAAPR